jgi:hypothetical protein
MKFSLYAQLYLAAHSIPWEKVPPDFQVWGPKAHKILMEICPAEAHYLFYVYRIERPHGYSGWTAMIAQVIYDHNILHAPTRFTEETLKSLLSCHEQVSMSQEPLRLSNPATAARLKYRKNFLKLDFLQMTARLFISLMYSRASGKRNGCSKTR